MFIHRVTTKFGKSCTFCKQLRFELKNTTKIVGVFLDRMSLFSLPKFSQMYATNFRHFNYENQDDKIHTSEGRGETLAQYRNTISLKYHTGFLFYFHNGH